MPSGTTKVVTFAFSFFVLLFLLGLSGAHCFRLSQQRVQWVIKTPELTVPPASEVCLDKVIVTGAESVAIMGEFTKIINVSDGQNGWRSIYRNLYGQYIYYWAETRAWMIGSNYSSAVFSLISTFGIEAFCPTDPFIWLIVEGETLSSRHGISVTMPCPATISVTGAEAVQAVCMGEFTKISVTPDSQNGGQPVYTNNHLYLYYWAALKVWLIGSDYTDTLAGVRTAFGNDAACPIGPTTWFTFDGDAWSSEYPISVIEGPMPESTSTSTMLITSTFVLIPIAEQPASGMAAVIGIVAGAGIASIGIATGVVLLCRKRRLATFGDEQV